MSSETESPAEHLERLDQALGTRLTRVVDVAKELSGKLDGVLVLGLSDEELEASNLDGTPQVNFYREEDGGIFSEVTFGTHPRHVQVYIDGPHASRSLDAKELLIRRGLQIIGARLIEVAIAHELGHVSEINELYEQMGPAAFRHGDTITRREYWSLPLALPTSDAIRCWETNSGGYRSCLETFGYTEALFRAKVHENVEAYNKLPSEKRADDFALAVLGEVYPA